MAARHQPADTRRAQIFEAAAAVCEEKGYHATRIDDIAERAGLSKGAVYHHFRSKRDIFLGVLDQMMEEYTGVVQALHDSGAGVSDTMNAMVLGLQAMVAHGPRLLRAMFELYLVGLQEPELRQRFERQYATLLAVGTRIFARAIERGELRPDVDPAEVSRMFFMSGDGIILVHLMLDEPAQAARTVAVLAEVMMRGLARVEQEGAGQ